MLTQEYLQSILDYNKDTGIFTWKNNTIAGTQRANGYIQIGLNYKIYKAHRLAWFWVYGTWPDKNIDHINGIRDDNRIENLRNVTYQENNQNKSKHRDGALVGASFKKTANKWQVRITINKKRIHLGLYNTQQEAHEAYLREVAKYG